MVRVRMVLPIVCFLLCASAHATDNSPSTHIEKHRTHQHLKKYEHLSKEEKEKLRQNWQKYKSLPPQRQKVIQQNLEKFRRLSPEEKQKVIKIAVKD